MEPSRPASDRLARAGARYGREIGDALSTFAWGFGFYGNSVYVAVLHDTRGWSLSLITGATTLYYLAGAVLLMYVHRAIEVLGPQLLLISGAVILGVATIGFTRSQAPWQRAP
jgi:hypothetical protein